MSCVLNRQRASGSGAQGGGGFIVENSLRFNDNDSAYLSFTKGAPTDSSKGVMGVWLKRANISLSAISTIVYGSPGESTRIEITNATDVINIADDGVQCLETNHVFRDPTAWFHLLLSYDSDEGTAANRLKMFLNGVEITSFAADGRSNIASGEEWGLLVNGGVQQWGFGAGAGTYWDGYMAQAFIIDGTSFQNGDYTIGDFCPLDTNGNPIPIDIVEVTDPTFGNNGSLLDFSIAPGTSNGAGTDVSRSFSLDIIDDTQTYTTNSATYGAAANAADGNAGTHWSTGNSTTPDWWSVDLGSGNAKAVIRVEFDFRSDANQDSIQIYGGNTDDGGGPIDEEATQLATAARSYGNNETQALEFSNTVAYRYYWIYFNGTANGTAGAKDVRMYTAGDFGVNHFSESGLAANDQMSDSPTDDADNYIGNYCTLNPISPASLGGSSPLLNGNLDMRATGGGDESKIGTIGVSSGKYYWECVATDTNVAFGVASQGTVNSGDMKSTSFTSGFLYGTGSEAYGYNGNTGNKIDDDNSTSYGNTYSTEIIGIALDLDNGAIWFSKAGAWQNASTDSATTLAEIIAGTTTDAAFSDLTSGEVFYPLIAVININQTYSANFGQQAFNTAAPTGFKALNTANLPAPAIKDASSSFTTHGYTGTGSAHDETFGNNTSMDPDLVIIKNRDTTDAWNWVDSVRGATKELNSNSTAIESTDADGLDDLSVTDGFGLGTGAAGYNDNNEDFISYNWKANGAGSSNTDGSINTTKTSVNAAAGFSISTYTGTGANATIGHGLNNAPRWVVIKKFSGSVDSWHVYHAAQASDPQTDYLVLDTNAALVDSATVWNDTAPTSSVVSLGTDTGVNGDGVTYIAYCWEEIEGFSKFGVFTGNSAADGTYVFCGFKPALVIIKRTDAARVWRVHDNTKIIPGSDAFLELDGTTVDSDSSGNASTVDFLANGFKLRGNSSHQNTGNLTFMAWAEFPFGGLGVSQARAG